MELFSCHLDIYIEQTIPRPSKVKSGRLGRILHELPYIITARKKTIKLAFKIITLLLIMIYHLHSAIAIIIK